MDRKPAGSRGYGRATNPQNPNNGQRRPVQPNIPGGTANFPPLGGTRPGPAARGSPVPGAGATHLPTQRPPVPSNVQGAAAGGEPQGQVIREDMRGAVRDQRVISEILNTRPNNCVKTGTTGHKVIVQANYFRVLRKPKWSIYQYRVDFAPDVDLIRCRRAYLAQHKALFGGYVFDGTVLFCTTYLADKMVNGLMELITKNREGETIQIKIKHVGIVEATDMQQLQVLNLILRRAMEGLNLQLVGRNFFDALAKINLDTYNMEIWPGYTTSIRQHEQHVLLCAEISHKVMRTDTLYHILSQCIRQSGDYQSAFKQEIIGMVVLTDYNNKTYRVDDVDFNSSPLSKFATKDGDVSFVEYYKKRYNITIRDTKQPLLASHPTEKNIRGGQSELILLIPELARATGMNDAMRNNFRLMKAMGDHTRLPPDRRIERLRAFNRRLQESAVSTDVFKSWNMKLDLNLVEIPARVLPPENIVFGKNKRYVCNDQADWSNQFRNTEMHSQVAIKKWCIIVPRRYVNEAQDFVKSCIRAAQGMRMSIAPPQYQEMNDDRNNSYSKAIDAAASQDPQLLMLVLKNNNCDSYSCIKKKCCVERPIPSQVVTLKTISDPRKVMSVATKVVIQMNAKLRGAPWMVDIPLKGLMTVGFDVCHSAKDRNKSYGALIATMDLNKSTHYYSAVTEHMKGQEISNEIVMYMTQALRAYREENGTLPERILFYRDGVGDGQLHYVQTTELGNIKVKLNEIYKSAGIETGCRFAFIVVSKRINTRYFINNRNPVPGTVVDDIITLPERYDFFLVSQSVRQGTVSPTSYNVIHDTMGLSPDRLQMLTYKFTHMYYNWAGTCRVPSVCQYAHKLAFLVAEFLNKSPHSGLGNQLFFL